MRGRLGVSSNSVFVRGSDMARLSRGVTGDESRPGEGALTIVSSSESVSVSDSLVSSAMEGSVAVLMGVAAVARVRPCSPCTGFVARGRVSAFAARPG